MSIAGALRGLILLAAGASANGAGAVTVDVLLDRDDQPYRQTLEGLRRGFADATMPVTLRVLDVSDGSRSAVTAMHAAENDGAALVVCVGTSSCEAAQSVRRSGSVPLVAAAVGDERAIGDKRGATGVYLNFLPEIQLAELARLFPSLRRVGVLYARDEGESEIANAREAARALGLTLVAVGIGSPRELPAALRKVLREADVLWARPDPRVLTPQSARDVMLAAFRARIPVIGASSSWVRGGALYALERDYLDIGRQAAELSRRILEGTPIDTLAPSGPRRIGYSLNSRTAEHMNLSFSNPLRAGAQSIYD